MKRIWNPNWPLWLSLAATLFGLGGCGKYPLEWKAANEPPPTVMEYSMEGVKLLSPAITQGDDPRSFLQSEYPVSGTEHVLLRLLELKEHVSLVRLRENEGVELRITLVDATQAEAAVKDLEVCPVSRNWMMLSTWEFAHPFSGEGRWSQAGGDFDASACLKATRAEGARLLFDVTQWFKDYPRGRGQNFGLLLRAPGSYRIHGDKSASLSPRLLWKE